MTLTTKQKITLTFTLFTAVITLLFGVCINGLFFLQWFRWQNQKFIAPPKPVNRLIEVIQKQRNSSFMQKKQNIQVEINVEQQVDNQPQIVPINVDPSVLAFIQQNTVRKNLIHKDNTWYLVHKNPLHNKKVFFMDVTENIERQFRLLRVSFLFFGIVCISSYFLAHIVLRKPLQNLTKIASLMQKSNIDEIHSDKNLAEHMNPKDEVAIIAHARHKVSTKLNEQIWRMQQFIWHVAHEFKTPFMILQSDSELALHKHTYKQWLEKNMNTIQHLSWLLDVLLNITHAQAKQHIQKEPLAMHALIQSVQTDMQSQNQQKNITRHINTPHDIYRRTNKESAYSIIYNICTNAYKYTPEWWNISVELTQDSITITDTGIGISEDQLSQIRQPFWQADISKQKDSWRWLWLSLVAALANQLERTIDVASSEHWWTSFVIHNNTLKLPT